MKKYVAFFDLDGTILSLSSGSLFIRYLYNRKLIGWKILIKGFFFGIMHKIRFMSTDDVFKKWAKWQMGSSEKEFMQISKECFDNVIVHFIRDSIIEEIDIHKRNNGMLVILSASTRHICEPVRSYLGMDDILCTELEVKEGFFTGEVQYDYCYGREKLKRALEFCQHTGNRLDEAYYYADSFADIYTLEKVGNPVCVSPARKLRLAAMRKKWRIIES